MKCRKRHSGPWPMRTSKNWRSLSSSATMALWPSSRRRKQPLLREAWFMCTPEAAEKLIAMDYDNLAVKETTIVG